MRGGLLTAALALAGLTGPAGARPLAAQQHGHMHDAPPRPARPRAAAASARDASARPGPGAATLVVNGTRVAFDVMPVGDSARRAVREGEDARLRLWLSDAASGRPLTARTIGAWVDVREAADSTPLEQCTQRVASYLREGLQTHPVADLNSYQLVVLNRSNTLTVIDPFMGFGSTHLYTTVQLPGVGEDWTLDPAEERLYVTIPLHNLVAVVDVDTWTVAGELSLAAKPMRVRFQPDGARLWVATDVGDSSGVSAIDPATRRVVGHVTTGRGHHELAFTDDSRYAFVTNPEDGTVTVVETAGVRRVAQLAVRGRPVDVAYSPVGRAVYVAGADGSVTIVDPSTRQVRDRLRDAAGLVAIEFDHSGRWGFLLNAPAHRAYVLDAASDSVTHVFRLPGAPDQVTFSHSFAYVHMTDTADVMMIPLHDLAPGEHGSSFAQDYAAAGNSAASKGGVVAVPFPAGTLPPDAYGGELAIATAMSRAPEHGDAVYIPNPAEKVIYYYHYMEGMPTPSGSLDNYGFEPVATMTVGRHLEESSPGLYTATLKAPAPGAYDLAFVLDEPRVVHCFPFRVADNPRLATTEPVRLELEAVAAPELVPGEVATVRFRLREQRSGKLRAGLAVRAEVMSPSGWSRRLEVSPEPDSTYAVRVVVPQRGVYYLSAAIPELHRGFRDQHPLVLRTGNITRESRRR